jgi:acyl-CoA thioester hydrolase
MRHQIDTKSYSFQMNLRARFTEADLQGMIHHSEYIKYFEIARIEYWRQLGIGYREFLAMGLQFVVSEVKCNYLKPVYFDDIITINARVSRLTRTSATFDYLIYDKRGEPVITGSTLLVCVRTGEGKPYPMPADFLTKLMAFEKPGTIEWKAGKAHSG